MLKGEEERGRKEEGFACVRVGQVVDEDGGALGHGQDGVGLDLRVGREDALGQARDDGSREL